MELIADNHSNLRKLFSVFAKLLHQRTEAKYPRHVTSGSLAQYFVFYFGDKIKKICDDLGRSNSSNIFLDPDVCVLNAFSSVSSDEIMKIVTWSSFKSCESDPIPGQILKGCIAFVLPTMTKVVNLFLETGLMSTVLKEAIIKPLLKKSSLNPDEFKNFRPILNLCFLSKIIEKCVAKQLIEYLDFNGLSKILQFIIINQFFNFQKHILPRVGRSIKSIKLE